MGFFKQVQSIKIYPSGWLFVAFLGMVGFLIGSILDTPILFMFGLMAVGVNFFRIKTPIISTNLDIITAPVSGKVSYVGQINLPDKLPITPQQYLKIGIRCGLLCPTSLHAPTSIKILNKQKVKDVSSRKIVITAKTQSLGQNKASEELVLGFCSAIPRWFPECDVEINDTLSQGQIFGFLSFGSQMDLYVPDHFSPLRIVNQTCIAGETILARGG